MYREYWGLSEKPFENVADPRFIYYTREHEEALSRLNYVVMEQKAAAVLTGVFGCGKTLIAQALINSLNKAKYEIAFIVNPQLSHVELLREIIYNLGIKENLPTLKTDIMHILDARLHHNMDDGKSTVVIIDEAHLIEDKLIFEEDAINTIYENSGGIPRRINQICSMALLTGFGMKKETIDSWLINEVAQEYV